MWHIWMRLTSHLVICAIVTKDTSSILFLWTDDESLHSTEKLSLRKRDLARQWQCKASKKDRRGVGEWKHRRWIKRDITQITLNVEAWRALRSTSNQSIEPCEVAQYSKQKQLEEFYSKEFLSEIKTEPERLLPSIKYIELPAKLPDYFLRSNGNNINQKASR